MGCIQIEQKCQKSQTRQTLDSDSVQLSQKTNCLSNKNTNESPSILSKTQIARKFEETQSKKQKAQCLNELCEDYALIQQLNSYIKNSRTYTKSIFLDYNTDQYPETVLRQSKETNRFIVQGDSTLTIDSNICQSHSNQNSKQKKFHHGDQHTYVEKRRYSKYQERHLPRPALLQIDVRTKLQ